MSLLYTNYRLFAAVFIAVVFFTVPFFTAAPAGAQWRDCGVVVCSATGHQENPLATPCGNGGAVIAWTDARDGDKDIYIQRIDDLGNPLWTSGGVLVCGRDYDQSIMETVPDGEDGVIVMWMDSHDDHIFAQRVDGFGNPLWTTNGVAVSQSGIYGYMGASMAPDGAGGAYFAWCDTRFDSYGDIYAQHLDSLGVLQAGIGGFPVCTIPNEEQTFPVLVSDGGDGALVVWRSAGDPGGYRLYAQRLNWWCNPLWTWPDGVNVTSEGDQWFYDAAMDDAGGVIVSYIYSYCTGGVYAQRLDGSGNLLWTSGGVQLHPPTLAWAPVMVKDGLGGAIVVWEYDNVGFSDVEAQAVDASGNIRWPAEGVMLCDEVYEQVHMTIAADGTGGAFVAWQDARALGYYDVFAQHVDSSGACMWDEDGTPVCSGIEDFAQVNPTIVADGRGGAIVAWEDARDPANKDIYANRMQVGTSAGEGAPPLSNHLAQNYPNPFHPVTTISFELSETGPVSLRVYDIRGRLIRTLMDSERSAGPHAVQWDGKDNDHQPVAGGVYLYRLTSRSSSQTKKMVLLK